MLSGFSGDFSADPAAASALGTAVGTADVIECILQVGTGVCGAGVGCVGGVAPQRGRTPGQPSVSEA
ncbi:hypothetical protein NOGI109294_22960 [Nocardiopsis gilva]|uniref:hypothetical protein n=1 Tax=Nocardiopsis gilva TaxID=280236 RepID=UPI000349B232|nr:hypothetical protein [Nocardiopsis gilva]